MSIYKDILFYLSVPKCVCCDNRLSKGDRALCSPCFSEYLETKRLSQCSHCLKNFSECLCPNDYLEKHFVHKLIKLFRYKPSESVDERIPANQLIYVAKRNKRIDLLDLVSDDLCHAIKASINYDGYVVTSVPRDRKRVRKYGFDHSECLAKAIAEKLGLKYKKLLKSKSKKAQKKTHGEERIRNAVFDYKKRIPDLKGKKVLLVDDIVTTGASLGNSASLIKGLGVKSIVGVCIGVTYKDKYVPFLKTKSQKI